MGTLSIYISWRNKQNVDTLWLKIECFFIAMTGCFCIQFYNLRVPLYRRASLIIPGHVLYELAKGIIYC